MATLYTTAVSANGRKALALAKQLALDVEVVSVNVYRGEGSAAAYRALNPWGKVPTLVDGELVLWESNAILVYLSEACADFALSVRSHKGRANILRWMFWEASHWQPMLTRVLAPRVAQILFPETGVAPARVVWDDPQLERMLRVLDAVFERDPFVCGPQLSIADFSIAGMTTYFRATGFPEGDYPMIAAWLGRMNQLPGWLATEVEPWQSEG